MEQQAENVLPPAHTITPPIVPGVLLQSIPQMPPLGPAPPQLPPLVHPPPAPPSILEPQVEPVQSQFETLNLNSPSEPVNIESSTLPPPLPSLPDGIPTASASIDTNGESSLVPEEGQTGVYSTEVAE